MAIMKKMLAGVLAAASVLSVSATAFALEGGDTAAITKPTEKEYSVGTGVLNVELDLEIPAKFQAFLNPYGAQVEIKEKIGTTDALKSGAGVVSYAYEFVNNTTDFGVSVDATAITTGSLKTSATAVNATAATAKEANMALVAADTAAKIAGYGAASSPTGIPVANAKMTGSANGVLVLNSAATAGSAYTGSVAGETKQSAWGHIPALTTSGSTKTPGKLYAGFVGALANSTTAPLEYTDDDAVEIALVLKFNPGATTTPTT